MAGIFEGCEEKEVGIVREGDIGLGICTFEDAKFDNWRWVDGTSIGRGYDVGLAEVSGGTSIGGAYILHPIRKLWRAQAVG